MSQAQRLRLALKRAEWINRRCVGRKYVYRRRRSRSFPQDLVILLGFLVVVVIYGTQFYGVEWTFRLLGP